MEWEYGEKPDRISRIDVVIRNVASQLEDEKRVRAFRGIARGCTVSKTLKIQPETSLKVE